MTVASATPTFTEQGNAILGVVNFNARSVSLADFDDDGDLDMFYMVGSGSQKLYRNNLVETGSLGFTNAFALLPSGPSTSAWSAAWGDYDGDGKVDVFVGQTNMPGEGDLLKNNGLAGFSNESAATGLNDTGFHQNVAWSDIDNDRDLDLLIGMETPDQKNQIYLQGAGNVFTPVGAAVPTPTARSSCRTVGGPSSTTSTMMATWTCSWSGPTANPVRSSATTAATSSPTSTPSPAIHY